MARPCPTCGNPTLTYFPRPQRYRCTTESCGEEFTPAQLGDEAPAPHALAGLIARWPSVLALPLHAYAGEPNPVLKLWYACDTVELTLRLLVTLGIAERARDGALPDDLARKLHPRIERPVLGHWQGMAEILAAEPAPTAEIAPEARAYVRETLVPLLTGPAAGPTAENSFTRLRNRLAHGAGVTASAARKLLALWQPHFEAAMLAGDWLGDLTLAARRGDGFVALRGTGTPTLLAAEAAQAFASHAHRDEALLAGRGDRGITLWPLALFGAYRAPEAAAGGEAPMMYVRRGEVRLEFTPLGAESVCEAEGDQASLEAFQALFRFDRYRAEAAAREYAVRGFEAEIRRDAEQLVGRAAELETLHRAVAERDQGVLWVPGLAGVGKSYLLARLADDLLTAAAPDRFVLAYRFRAGDAERCSREAFVRFAVERLTSLLAVPAGAGDERNEKPLDKLRRCLEHLGPARRVLFVLDGLDELGGPDFVREVIGPLRLRGVTWLCAGRPERGLPEAFTALEAALPFTDGLPRMSEGDIRTMLVEKLGTLRKRLVKGDRDEGDRVLNPFVERVASRAQGLPIYVRYVVGDVLQGKLTPDAEENQLPPSLAAYHAELLRRCTVGDLHQVLTPLAATLALAREPATVETLAALLVRRRVLLAADAAGLELVRRALAAMGAMVNPAPTPDGVDGYTLWHESLRTFILESPESTLAVATARRSLADEGLKPAGDAAEKYLYRCGIGHLLDDGRREEALEVVTTWDYMQRRLESAEAFGPAGLSDDWVRVLVPGEDVAELKQLAAKLADRAARLRRASKHDELGSWRFMDFYLYHASFKLGARIGGVWSYRPLAELGAQVASELSEQASREFLETFGFGVDDAINPFNLTYQRTLAVAYDRMGGLEERADMTRAREWFTKSLEVRERLVAIEPRNTIYLRDLALAYDHLGDIESRADSARARAFFLKGLEIRERLSAGDPSDATYLRDLSISWGRLGTLDGRENPVRAREWLIKNLEIVEGLLAREPDDPVYLRDLLVCCNKLGDLDGRADVSRARQWFLKSLTIAERLAALDPNNTTYQSDLSHSFRRLADLDGRADPARARQWLFKGLAIAERLAKCEPDDTTYQRDLCVFFDRLGELDDRSDSARARDWFLRSLAIVEQLSNREPDNTGYLFDLASMYRRLGILDQWTDSGSARRWFDEGLRLLERLVALEPRNAAFMRDLAVCHVHHGDLDRYTDPARACQSYLNAFDNAERLGAQEPDNTTHLRDLGAICGRLGELDGRTDPARARQWFLKGVELATRLIALEPDNSTYLRDLASFYAMLGDLEEPASPAGARAWFLKGVEIAERLVVHEPDNTTYLRDLSVMFSRLGQLDSRTDAVSSRRWHGESLALTERLAALEPENTLFMHDLWVSYESLRALDERADPARAAQWFHKSFDLAERLVGLNPSNLAFQAGYSASLLKLSEMQLADDPVKAMATVDRTVEIRRSLTAVDPADAELWNLLAYALGRRAALTLRAGDAAGGHASYAESLSALARSAELAAETYAGVYLRACVHALGGDVEAALTALERAAELGTDDPERIANEPDFAALREHPRFEAVLGGMRRSATRAAE